MPLQAGAGSPIPTDLLIFCSTPTRPASVPWSHSTKPRGVALQHTGLQAVLVFSSGLESTPERWSFQALETTSLGQVTRVPGVGLNHTLSSCHFSEVIKLSPLNC